MANASRDRDLERLESEIQGEKYRELLRNLQMKNRFLRQFKTWGDVLTFMTRGAFRDPRKDEVLRPIFTAHVEDEDPRWRAILLAFFWPGLESIHNQKCGWDPDPDERWQNIVWTFLKVICRIDLKKRSDRLVQKVFNDTVYYLHEEYGRIWRQANHEFSHDPDDINALSVDIKGFDFTSIELREAQNNEIRRLRDHMEAGRISEADFLLLVGTRVYRKTVADHAREEGIDYQVAKKRRQRAEATIRRFEVKRSFKDSRSTNGPIDHCITIEKE